MGKVLAAAASAAPSFRDVAAVGGLGMIFYGTRLIYEPAAWIVVGGLMFGTVILSLMRFGGGS